MNIINIAILQVQFSLQRGKNRGNHKLLIFKLHEKISWVKNLPRKQLVGLEPLTSNSHCMLSSKLAVN